MTFLLDTNVVSDIRKRTPDPGLAAWWKNVSAATLYVSALTIGELHRGVERIRAGGDERQAEALSDWLTTIVDAFADRVLPVDASVARTWGRLLRSQPCPVVDGLIAATAMRHDLTLVTRNARDVKRTGVRLLDPFTRR